MDPTRTVGATGRTLDAGRMDGQTDGQGETNTPHPSTTTLLCGGYNYVTMLYSIWVSQHTCTPVLVTQSHAKYKMIYWISNKLYRYTYRIYQTDRYSALVDITCIHIYVCIYKYIYIYKPVMVICWMDYFSYKYIGRPHKPTQWRHDAVTVSLWRCLCVMWPMGRSASATTQLAMQPFFLMTNCRPTDKCKKKYPTWHQCTVVKIFW